MRKIAIFYYLDRENKWGVVPKACVISIRQINGRIGLMSNLSECESQNTSSIDWIN